MNSEITYSEAGVDIESADEAVRRLTPHVRSTFRPEVISEVGGFGSIVAIPDLSLIHISEPTRPY